jgi:hypothetical protein
MILLRLEQFRQRYTSFFSLVRHVCQRLVEPISLETIEFYEGDPRLSKAATIVEALPGSRYAASSIRNVTFRPYPSKCEGAWRVEVGFHLGLGGGVEFYVDENDFVHLWRVHMLGRKS